MIPPGATIEQVCVSRWSVRIATDQGTYLIEPVQHNKAGKEGNEYTTISIRPFIRPFEPSN